ncbi:MAG: hypothetical protein R3A51_12745 [Nannocystaceae bacterium]
MNATAREVSTPREPVVTLAGRNASRVREYLSEGPARDAMDHVLELVELLVPGSDAVLEPCDADTDPWVARLIWRRDGWRAMVHVDRDGRTDWVALGHYFTRSPREVIRCLRGEASVREPERV